MRWLLPQVPEARIPHILPCLTFSSSFLILRKDLNKGKARVVPSLRHPSTVTYSLKANTALAQPSLSTPMPSGWASWTSAERGGVIAAIVVFVLGILGSIAVAAWRIKTRKERSRQRQVSRVGRRSRRRAGRRRRGEIREERNGSRRRRTRERDLERNDSSRSRRHGVLRASPGMEEAARHGENGRESEGKSRSGDPRDDNVNRQRQGSRSSERDRSRRRARQNSRENPRDQRLSERYEMSGALGVSDDGARVPVGQRPLLPPNQQRRVRIDEGGRKINGMPKRASASLSP